MLSVKSTNSAKIRTAKDAGVKIALRVLESPDIVKLSDELITL